MSAREPSADPFRAVHRANRRRTFGFSLAGVLAASAILATTWVVPAAVAGPGGGVADTVGASLVAGAPAAASADSAVPGGAPGAVDAASGAASTIAAPPAAPPATAVLPEGAAGAGAPIVPEPPQHPPASPPADATPPAASPVVHTIGIDATGYQAELDDCLWVRMDLAGASAPIVGAHNNCGGELVLDVKSGDLVDLAGQNLDGRYMAVGSRDGYPGQDAGEATAGFGATVILQTCYLEGPNVRLVALVRVA